MGFMDTYLQKQEEEEGSPVNRWAAMAYNVECLLGEIRDALTDDPQATKIDPLDLPFVVQTDGAGFATVNLQLRPGVSWKLMGIAYQMPAAAAVQGYIAFYRDQEVGSNLYKVSALSTIVDEAFTQGQQVPDQSTVVIVVRGGPVNTTISGRLFATATTYGNPHNTTHS